MSSRQHWLRFRSCRLSAVTATGIRLENSSPPSSVNSLLTGRTLIMVVDDDRIYPRDAIQTIFIITNNCPMPRFAFAGVRCRAASIGTRPK